MAAPNGSRWPAAAVAAGVARGEGAAELRACGERTGEGDVTLSRASADGLFAAPPAVPAGLPGPVAASPATVPAATAAQTASATSTIRMGARGGLDPETPEDPERPEPACLPFAPDTDVLTTIPIVSFGSQGSQPTAGG